MTPILDIPPKTLLPEFVKLARASGHTIDAARLHSLATRKVAYLKLTPTEIAHSRVRDPVWHVIAMWYRSLAAGSPDFGVYRDVDYLADLWGCYVTYSRQYLRKMRTATLKNDAKTPALDAIRTASAGKVTMVADLGCGFGYEALGLVDVFDAHVFAFDIAGTPQWNMVAYLGKHATHHVSVVSNLTSIPLVDVVWASEYFEHIERPIDHVLDVLDTLKPAALICANTFSSPSIGHFNRYIDERGDAMDGKATAKAFDAAARSRGYHKTKTTLWNGRPSLYLRARQ